MSPITGTPLLLVSREQLEDLARSAAEQGAALALRRFAPSKEDRWLSNAQAAERYASGNANAWRCYVTRYKEHLKGCYQGDGRRRRWDADRLEEAVQKIARRGEPGASIH